MILHSGFFWILLAGAVYGLIHSGLASTTAKSFASRRFGETGAKYYRLFFVIIATITLLPYAGLIIWLPDSRLYVISSPWIYLTLFIQGLALIGLALSPLQTRLISFVGIDVLLRPNQPVVSKKLNTSGVYRLVRHPIYTFTFLFLWFMPLMTWNLLALIIGLTLYTLIGSVFEEQKLVTTFGNEYSEYQKRTPAFLPRLLHKR